MYKVSGTMYFSLIHFFFSLSIGFRVFSFSFFSLFKFVKFLNFIKVYLIYNIVLVSGRQHSDSFIQAYLFFFRFFSLIGYYKILSIVPCAIQYVFVSYLFYV